MTEDLDTLERWAGALLVKLSPTRRRVINRNIAIALRQSVTRRIAGQKQPDGASFIPRKPRKYLRGKTSRIKRRSQAMFAKIRTTRHMKLETTGSQLAIGFFGRIARIANVHQHGLCDKVAKNGPDYQYPVRPLLGFSAADREMIRDMLLDELRSS